MNTRRLPEELAGDLIPRSTHPEFRISAVVFDRKGTIFAWGWNNGWNHAEAHALSRANRRRLAGSTILVLGVKKSSRRVFTTKPCEGCERRILAAGLAKVIYSVGNQENPLVPVWQMLESALIKVRN